MAKETAHPQLIHKVLRLLPSATFVLTCTHDKFRDGILTSWVQQCSTEPPMLIVAIPKGQQIEPMLRDARAFALCLVPPNDRRAMRLFNREHERDEDPFLALTTITAETGMPILPESKLWFDCKLEGHLSPEADCKCTSITEHWFNLLPLGNGYDEHWWLSTALLNPTSQYAVTKFVVCAC